MTQRLAVLSRYFFGRWFRSVSGALYVLFAFAYWLILFNPQQQTPEVDYFILVLGLFGPVAAFLITLTISSWANQAVNYPFLVRLPSRVEYLTAVAVAAFLATFLLQLLMTILTFSFGGPALTLGNLLEIPPLWFPPIILAITLALHASDLVSKGWSRVYLFGLLAIFLFARELSNDILLRLLSGLNRYINNQGWFRLMEWINNAMNAISNSNSNIIARVTDSLFWPFEAIIEAVLEGQYTATQAIAPAILLIYATILFILAADLFGNKDLIFTEA